MFNFKRIAAVLFISVFLSSGLFAQVNIIDDFLDGNQLNDNINTFIHNMARLVPDSTTTQNIWSYAPRHNRGIFGAGINGSFTMSERKMLGQLVDARGKGEGFGGKDGDILNIPESIPYLPAAALDFRFGVRGYDFGLTGMWTSADLIPELASIIGEDSDYTHRTIGFDFRYALITDGRPDFFGIKIPIPAELTPAITAQVGYYFTWMTVGFASAEASEKVRMDFRNDSYFIALQASKEFLVVKPYVGLRLITSRTDSEYEWETYRPVTHKGIEYPYGARYNSGVNARESYNYLHFYGGAGFSFIFDHIFTLGFNYSVFTKHFGVNAALRFLVF